MMQFGFNNNCRLGFTFRVMQKTNLVSESSKFAILLQFCFYLQHKLSLLRSRLIGPGSVGSAGQYWVTPAQVATKKKKTQTGSSTNQGHRFSKTCYTHFIGTAHINRRLQYINMRPMYTVFEWAPTRAYNIIAYIFFTS